MLTALTLVAIVTASLWAPAATSCNGTGIDELPETLHFAFVTSFGAAYNTSGVVPALDYALERINADQRLLPNRTLQYYGPWDSGCDRTQTLDVYFGNVSRPEPSSQASLAVLGCGCSQATIAVAEISHYNNMPTISYASSAEALSNRHQFRSFFRTDGSEKIVSPSFASFVQHFGWKQIGIISQQEALFLDTQEEIQSLLTETNVSVKTVEFSTEKGPSMLTEKQLFFEAKDVRVFFLNMYNNNARVILCQAFLQGKLYPRYAWITPGWYRREWWRGEGEEGVCNDTAIEAVLRTSLAFLHHGIVNGSELTDTGITRLEFEREYKRRLATRNYLDTVNSYLAYDATWTLALALNRSLAALGDECGGVGVGESGESGVGECGSYCETMTQCTSDLSTRLFCLLHCNLQETNFLGVSGRVEFDENGTRLENNVRVDQYQDSGGGNIARISVLEIILDSESNQSYFIYYDNQSNETIWPEGTPPDGLPISTFTTVTLPLTVICCLLVAVGIAWAIICLVFNIVFRSRKVVRLTSPNLNYIIIAGAILLYLNALIFVIPTLDPTTFTAFCNLRSWLYTAGFAMCFGVVLAKTWRVYYIFTDPSANKKMLLKDWHLVTVVSIIVGLALLITLVATAVDGSRLLATETDSKDLKGSRNELGVRQVYKVYYCGWPDRNYQGFFWVGFVYQFILLVVSAFFAFRTRKVKIKALNDSKEIAAIVYASLAVFIVFITISNAVGVQYINIYSATLSGGNIIEATIILTILFIPKMVQLKKDPQGKNIFNRTSVATSVPNGFLATVSPTGDMEEKVTAYEKKIKELEEQLKASNQHV